MAAEEMETIRAARQFMKSCPALMTTAPLTDVAGACEKIETLYETFQEFELEFPRETIAAEIESAFLKKGKRLPGLLLLFCVGLAPDQERFTASLLKSMVGTTSGTSLFETARLIATAGGLSWAQILPSIDLLKRRQSDHQAMALASLVLKTGRVWPGLDMLALGQFLKAHAMEVPDSYEPDPLAFARTAGLATRRLASSGAEPDALERGMPDVDLIAKVDRLTVKFGCLPPPPPIEATDVRRIRSGRFTLPEFALMSVGMKADWLAFMVTGEAGKRQGQCVVSRPGVRGHMVFGPYFCLPPGRYATCVKLDVSEHKRTFSFKKPQPWAALDVVAGNGGSRCLAFLPVETRKSGRQELSCNFAIAGVGLDGQESGVEIRLWTDGSAIVAINAILVWRLPD